MNTCYVDNALSFGAVLEEWLAATRPKLKPTTCAAYETVLTRHLTPMLCDYAVSELENTVIERFLEHKSAEGLSPSTLRSISCVLRAALRYAGRYGCAASAELCKISATRKKTEISILLDDERGKIVRAIGENPQKRALGVLISLYTGIRVGEVCGLKWSDVSPDNRSITVRRTVSRIRSNSSVGRDATGAPSPAARTRVYIGEPKSSTSCRRIPIPRVLTAALEKARGEDDCFIVSGSAQKVPEPRAMQRFFNKLLAQAGIEHVNYHALRHSFATQCVDLGFDIKALSMILGHSDVGITLNTYVHPSFEKMRSMMEMLD